MTRMAGNFPVMVYVRLSTPMKAWLDDRASQEGLSTSTYTRRLLERAAKQDLQQGKGQDEGQN
jgi:hypothetical protein